MAFEALEILLKVVEEGADEYLVKQRQIADAILRSREEIKKLNQGLKDNENVSNLDTRIKNRRVLVAQLVDQKNELRKLQKEQRVFNKLADAKPITTDYEKLKVKLREVTKEFQSLTTSQAKGDLGKNFKAQIKSIRSDIDVFEQGAGQFQRNVGNYASAFDAFSGLNIDGLFYGDALITGARVLGGVLSDAASIVNNFEQAVADLGAISGATDEELKGLQETARSFAATSAFTAQEAIELQTELAKLGFNPEQIQASTAAIGNFSIAVGTDAASAAKLGGAAVRSFGLDVTETDRVVSALAISTTKSALDFAKLEVALPKVAPVAKALGFEIEEVVGLLGVLADSGFEASIAGTSLRGILNKLADPAGDLAVELGRPVESGRDLVEGLKELRDRGIDLAAALELTEERQVAAFKTFIDNADAAGNLTESITDVNDELQILVDKRLDTVQGQFKLLSSAWTEFILSVQNGDGVISNAVQNITKGFTNLLNALASLNEGNLSQLNGDTGVLASFLGGASGLSGLSSGIQSFFDAASEGGQIKIRIGIQEDSLNEIQSEIRELQNSEFIESGEVQSKLLELKKSELTTAIDLTKELQRALALREREGQNVENQKTAQTERLKQLQAELKALNQIGQAGSSSDNAAASGESGETIAAAAEEAKKERDRIAKVREKDAKELSKILLKIEDDLTKEFLKLEKEREKADANLRKLQISLIPDDFDRQIEEAKFKNDQLINALGGDPVQIQLQTDLLKNALVNQIEEIEDARAAALLKAQREREASLNLLNQSNAESDQANLNAEVQNITNLETLQTNRIRQEIVRVLSDDSLTDEERIEQEKILQAEIIRIELEAEVKRQSLIADKTQEGIDAELSAKKAAAQAEIDLKKAQADEEERIEKASRDKRIAIIQASFQAAADLVGTFQSIQDAQTEREINSVNRFYDARAAAAEGNAEELERIEEERADRLESLEREQFERNKRFAIAQALINGALAITGILASTAIDPTGILRGIQVGLVGLSTAAQVGIIAAQTFAKGGIVQDGPQKGDRHSDRSGGMYGSTPTGSLVNFEGGEIITNSKSAGITDEMILKGNPKQIISYINSLNGNGRNFAPGASRYYVPERPKYLTRTGAPIRESNNIEQLQGLKNEIVTAVIEGMAKSSPIIVQSEIQKANKLEQLRNSRKYAGSQS